MQDMRSIGKQYQQEMGMQGDSGRQVSRTSADAEQPCETVTAAMPSLKTDPSAWSNEEADPRGAKERLARLARAIETDVIPRLVQAHRPTGEPAAGPASTLTEADVQEFVQRILSSDEADLNAALDTHRERGVLVETLYIDLFAPAARQFGLWWEEDICDFSTVTVALGRLQRLLRELSPSFGAEVEHPAHGRRALFVQPRDEQHSFGLSMVAEFFRRDGWDVLGGVGGAVTDPASKVRDEWVDVIGFSVGTDTRIPWLTESIRSARLAARNPGLMVLVGGPPFTLNPELAAQCGADGTARDGREAPKLAERLLAKARQRK
jgi:methanogenic corrinoid protein MtbC1